MLALITLLLAVPVVDHGVKAWLGNALASRSVPLGMLGCVRLVSGRIWLARIQRAPRPELVWGLWAMSAVCLFAATLLMPAGGAFAGLLLGGALSHAIETTRRGVICDYICLRFWPAFNLADVAITIGGAGLVWCLFMVMKGGLA
jgi:signal peptidase II